MKRIVKIEGVGNVAFPDSLSDAEVSQAAGRLYDDANPTLANAPQAINDLKASAPTPSAITRTSEDTSDWRHIITSDRQNWTIHPPNLETTPRRDPPLIIR